MSDIKDVYNDYILPAAQIKCLEGFDDLTQAQQNSLLIEKQNFHPYRGT